MDGFLGLIGFSFVSSVTPGPNNVLLWASGAEFGFRRSLRHVVGTAVGIGLMTLAVAAGLGALVTTIPQVALVMKIAGSIYLLWLAFQIAGPRGLARGELARPMGLVQAAAFQAINPKAWIFAIGAISTFRPSEVPVASGSILVALTMMVVILPTAALWAAGGGALARFLTEERTQRVVSLALAAMVVATIVSVWV
jgi:threonine/homoserine/homoserine lactone efflux protein